ncbi:V-type proton ATPase subunit H [Cimex lectularius]|uniref:V-type proton ATPase subunit H n=1 Tax=Cimex lectularius TaxID=79782 RepID=A0A8I6ST94_CIMLE|nr:V-type proton ATPase subunit H [Cimex lectularius]
MAKANPDSETLKGLQDEKIDMLVATSVLQQQASEIRGQQINWQCYLQGLMISQEEFNTIVAFDTTDAAKRERVIKSNPTQLAKTFLNILEHVSKDSTIQYVLVLIDDMLQEDLKKVEIFREHSVRKKEPICGQFLNLLNGSDGFIVNMTARIIAKIASYNTELISKSDLSFYLTWLKDQLKIPNNQYMQSVARCLQTMLRIDEYKAAFISVDGITTLLSVLIGHVNFQIQYQLIFCIWVLTFNPKLAERMNKFSVIPILSDILSDSVKEKVTRIILATFRNLIEKPEDASISKEHCIAMVQTKVLKQLSILEQRKFDDEDIVEDVQFLNEKLQASVQDLSSFDEYATEVKTGRLEWSPVHRSAQFWRENAGRLNEKNYELLRILIHLLETSRDPLVLSVASYDIGEYVRHYPRGKHVIENLGGKQLVMQLLSHEDPNVRYEALLAVQKLMVHNWEYLGRQLEKEQTATAGKPTSGVLTGKA